MIFLRELGPEDERAFFEGMREWPENERDWYTFAWKPGMPYAEMLERLRKDRLGIELPEGRVRHTMLYAFDPSGAIVGRVSIRHELNDFLRKRGGHLGGIPSRRGSGAAATRPKWRAKESRTARRSASRKS